MKKYGFYLRVWGKDCFMESDKKNRTDAVTLEFLNKIQNHENRFCNIDANTVQYFKARMQPAALEVKTIERGPFAGLRYINIDGENFSYGCDACENPFDVVVVV